MKELHELFNWEKLERNEPVRFNILPTETTLQLAQNYQRFRKHVDLDSDCWIELNRIKYELGCKTLSETIRTLIRRGRQKEPEKISA